MQLAGWSETHNGGAKVTFWLQSPDDLEPFRALTVRKGNQSGQRFMAALVEIGDNELPVQPEAGIPVSEKPKIGPLAYWLVLRCNEPEFWVWLRSMDYGCDSPREAGAIVKEMLGLQSRKDLDSNPDNVDLFHAHIRGPYSKWCAARGVTA